MGSRTLTLSGSPRVVPPRVTHWSLSPVPKGHFSPPALSWALTIPDPPPGWNCNSCRRTETWQRAGGAMGGWVLPSEQPKKRENQNSWSEKMRFPPGPWALGVVSHSPSNPHQCQSPREPGLTSLTSPEWGGHWVYREGSQIIPGFGVWINHSAFPLLQAAPMPASTLEPPEEKRSWELMDFSCFLITGLSWAELSLFMGSDRAVWDQKNFQLSSKQLPVLSI